MSKDKTIKAHVESWKHKRGKELLDEMDISITEFLRGSWDDLIDSQTNPEYEAAVEEYYRLKGEVAALESREEMLLEQIEELRRQVDDVRSEREQKESRISELADELGDSENFVSNEDDGVEVSGGSYDDRVEELLIRFCNGKTGEIVESMSVVRDIATSHGRQPSEVIESLREEASVASEADELEYIQKPVERAFRFDDDKPLDENALEQVRVAVARERFGESDERLDSDAFVADTPF